MAGMTYTDLQANQLSAQVAQNAANQQYLNSKLAGDADTLAFQKAQAAFANAMSSAQTFGTSPGGAGMPGAGTPTMAQMNQWASLYGNAAAPANQYQQTLAAQNQQFTQQQTAQNNYAALSGYYTPTGYDQQGTIGAGVNLGQIDQALQASLGRDYNQNVFHSMTQGLQGQNLTSPQAMQGINAAIQQASQGRLQGYQDIAGQLGTSAFGQQPTQAQTMAMQQQQAGLTGMTTYSPYQAGAWLQDPNTGAYGQVSANGQVRSFNSLADAAAAGMPVANWANGQQADPARVQTVDQSQWGNMGQSMYTPQYQQQLFNQALQTAQFQQGTAQNYLQLLSQLQGPADYGNYLKVLGSTPQGIQGLVGAAAGAYIPGGGVTGTPQAASLQSLVGAGASGVSGGQYMSPAQWVSGPSTTGQNMNALPGAGTGAVAGGGGYSPAQAQQNGSGAPAPGQMGSIAPGTTTSYQDYMRQAQNLPAPSQLAPQAYNNMTTSQKQMLQGMYGQLGYNQQDINDLYNQSLPKYAAGGGGVQTGSFRLV
jgi:hypothetical protein